MKKNNFNQFYLDALNFIKHNLLKNSNIIEVLTKGSLHNFEEKVPYWSDIDISIITHSTSHELYIFLQECYSTFIEKYPEIKLSLTLVNKKDNLHTNCLHHHGIKPISFNFELKSQNMTFFSKMSIPNKDSIRMSSIYRYYEILYDFRKSIIQNKISDKEFVTKYFHRASRFIRTQFEILRPDLLYSKSIINEEASVKDFNYEEIVKDFFQKKNCKRKLVKLHMRQ